MKTQIFKNYKEFRKRKDKTINGVTKEFAEKHKIDLEECAGNEGCWNCNNCYLCDNCNNCNGCMSCNNCIDCNNCYRCDYCNDCDNLSGAIGYTNNKKGAENDF